jgi:putative SOS response-associated peptidase YedK
MCYDISKLQSKLKQGARAGHTPKQIEETIEDYKRIWRGGQVLFSGFSHPELPLVFRQDGRYTSELMTWGLVPSYIKDEKKAAEIMNMTINCQSETAFEKPSFAESIRHHRAILPVHGWFEHQHVHGKPFPYFIHNADDELMYMGCVYSLWDNPKTGREEATFSIVTTAGNELLTKIHNKPAQGQGARMPLLLSGDALMEWLHPETDINGLKELMVTFTDEYMDAYTVRPIRGKQELDTEQLSLF